eukprot:scaffold289139_cov33-Tisochrysis_lutea.AAC.1
MADRVGDILLVPCTVPQEGARAEAGERGGGTGRLPPKRAMLIGVTKSGLLVPDRLLGVVSSLVVEPAACAARERIRRCAPADGDLR